jgi:hypothetical protein
MSAYPEGGAVDKAVALMFENVDRFNKTFIRTQGWDAFPEGILFPPESMEEIALLRAKQCFTP